MKITLFAQGDISSHIAHYSYGFQTDPEKMWAFQAFNLSSQMLFDLTMTLPLTPSKYG